MNKIHKLELGQGLHTKSNYRYMCNWSVPPNKKYSSYTWDNVTCKNCLKMKNKQKLCIICGKKFRTLNNKDNICEECKREEY